jgi:general secretion pathway protein H
MVTGCSRTIHPNPHDAMILHRRPAGFSLLELLVVVFIIGILATMFTLSVGLTGGNQALNTEADRFRALVALAREESVLQGREIGMLFFPDGYEFASYYEDFVEYHDKDTPDQSEWLVITDEDLLNRRTLPEGITIELEIDGRSISVDKRVEQTFVADKKSDSDEDDQEGEDDSYKPQVRFFSSGDVTPFVIHFRPTFESRGIMLQITPTGEVELIEDAA